MENKTELKNSEFYLIVQKSGLVFKSRDRTEFLVVCSWERKDLVIKKIVSNHQYLFFRTGKEVKRKKINTIPVSRSFETSFCYDIHNLNLNGGATIKKAWIGRKDEFVEIEQLT